MASHGNMAGDAFGSFKPTTAPAVVNEILDWAKKVMVVQLLKENERVCDLYCGRGGDIRIFASGKVGGYLGIDSSASAVEAARENWLKHGKPFEADFHEVDPCLSKLIGRLGLASGDFDVVSCQGHLQDSFLTEITMRSFLTNVAALLRPGGYFFGTCPDSSTIWVKAQKALQQALQHGQTGPIPKVASKSFQITFENDKFSTFGCEYFFSLIDGMPPQKQLLVHFPSLIRFAAEVGLDMVEISNLEDFYEYNKAPFGDLLHLPTSTDGKKRIPGYAKELMSIHATFVFRKSERALPAPLPHMSPLPTVLTSAPDTGLSDVSDGEAAPGAADDAFAVDGGSPMLHISSPPKIVAAPTEEEAAPGDPPAKAEVKRRRLRKVQKEAEVPVPGGVEKPVVQKTPAEAVGIAAGKTRLGRLRKAGEGPRGAGAEEGVTRAAEELKAGAASAATKRIEKVARVKATGDAEKVGTGQAAGVSKDAAKPDDAARGAVPKGAVQPLKKGVLKKVGKKGGIAVFVARGAGEKTSDSPRMRAEGMAILALAAFAPGADVPKVEKKRGVKADPGNAGSVPVPVKDERGASEGVRTVAAAPGKKGGRLRKRQGGIVEAATATASEEEVVAKVEVPEPEPEAAPPELPAEEPKPAAEETNISVEKAGSTARGVKKGAAKAGGLPGRPPPRRSSRFEKFDFGAAFQGSPTEFSLPEEWLSEAGGRKNRRMSIRVPSSEEGAPDQVLEAQIDEVGVRRARAASIEREIEAAQIEAVAEGKSEFVRGEGGEAGWAAEKGKGGQERGDGLVAKTEARGGAVQEGGREGDKGATAAEAGAVLRAPGKGGKKGKGKKQKRGGGEVESTAALAREAGPGVEASAGVAGDASAGLTDDPAAQPPSAGDALAGEESQGRLDPLTEAGEAEGVGRDTRSQAPAPDSLQLGWAYDEAQPFVGAVYTRAGKRKGGKAQGGGSGAAKEGEKTAVTGDGEPSPSVTPGKKRPGKGGRKSGAVEEAASERGGAGVADGGDSRTPTSVATSALESSPRLVRRVSTRRGGEQSQFLELNMDLPSPEYKRKKGGKGEGGGGKKNEGGEEKQGGGLEEGGSQGTEPGATGGAREHSVVGELPGTEAAFNQEGDGDGHTKEETDEAGDRPASDKPHGLSTAGTQGQGGQYTEENTEERPSGEGSDLAQSAAKEAQGVEPRGTGDASDDSRQQEATVAPVAEARVGLEEPGVSAKLEVGKVEPKSGNEKSEREHPEATGGLGRSGLSVDCQSEAAVGEGDQQTGSRPPEAGPAGEAGEDGPPGNSAHQKTERDDVMEQLESRVQDVTANEAERMEGGGELPRKESGQKSRQERG
ncbi:mRNA capping enzyme family protein [Klebsormidium nitens]|uniref:mRNA (guanine-N(7))-methyltransferase n=1 Tax=Klebsormidium nitens TaxID=105231 RepID=A0A1Y1IH84_KLENI|nr:mRNA capping enzyme family protein [Klebsormidium nitens]|eukprot:GAQ88077.1 mRNA capping enzyme family protein [Klebsormidium nitens]